MRHTGFVRGSIIGCANGLYASGISAHPSQRQRYNAHSVKLQLLSRTRLLHREHQPDVLLSPRQQFRLFLLFCDLRLVFQESYDGFLGLVARHMRVDEHVLLLLLLDFLGHYEKVDRR